MSIGHFGILQRLFTTAFGNIIRQIKEWMAYQCSTSRAQGKTVIMKTKIEVLFDLGEFMCKFRDMRGYNLVDISIIAAL